MSVVSFRRRKIPYQFFNANYILIGVNLAAFLLVLVFKPHVFYLALSVYGVIGLHSYWQLLTYFFIDVGIWALVFNLLGLFFFGTQVEREMGSIHYLLYYVGIGVLSGIVDFLIFYAFGLYDVPVIGSAGVVFAVLLAFASFYPDSVVSIMGIIPVRAPVLILIYVALDLVLALSSYGLTYLIQLTGFVLGFAYMLLRYRTNPFRHLFR